VGKKIRIVKGIVKRKTLLIEDCLRVRELTDSGNKFDKFHSPFFNITDLI
jgi:hypothetical protein